MRLKLISFFWLSAVLWATAQPPSFVLNIVVEGLDYDRLQQLSPYMKDDGFKRLMQSGVVIPTLTYGTGIDDAAAATILSTGASPSITGIGGDDYYDRANRLSYSSFYDPQCIGNATEQTLSPLSIRVTTVADEVRLDSNGLGNVHSIAPDHHEAIAAAGHAGNSAIWISDTDGRWASSTWYRDIPSVVSAMNHRRPLSMRLDTLSWGYAQKEAAIASLPSYKRIYPFRHSFPRSDTHRYKAFKRSARANDEVADMAIEYFNVLNLGKHEPLDMLTLTFTLQPYLFGKDTDNRAETIDAYLRLDAQLSRIFRAVDARSATIEKTLVVVSGTPVVTSVVPVEDKWNLPSGEFSPERAVSLLNMNLMTIFGNHKWVSGYHDGQIFLNRDLIKERGVNYDEVVSESVDFLRQMSGVAAVVSIDDLLAGRGASYWFPSAENIVPSRAGDIYMAITPGWTVAGEYPAVARRMGATSSCAFILAPSVGAKIIPAPVDARAIAPTICRLANIRVPDGSMVPAVKFE